MRIKEIKEFKNIKNEKINLNLEKRTLAIRFTDRIKQKCIRNVFLGNKENIHIISEDNKDITLVNIVKWDNDDEELILYLTFEYILVGNNAEEKINDINKYIVTFEKFNMLKENKEFEHNHYKCTLGHSFIQLIDKNQKGNSKDFLEEFLTIYELVCLFIGYFPKIQKVELDCKGEIIEEYSDLVYLYNSSADIIFRSFSLVDINKLNDLDKVINEWDKLKEKLGYYPIWGLFVSQMKDNHYLDYILVTLLQAIDGYCDVVFKEENKKKSTKDEKIINYLIECINKYDEIDNLNKTHLCKYLSDYHNGTNECRNIIEYLIESIKEYYEIKDRDKKKVCDYLNGYHDLCFKDYLEKLIKHNKEYSEKIFCEEIYLDNLYKNQDECGLYVGKELFLIKSINERRKISHMSKKDNTFTEFQILIAYYKWLLMYRIVLIKDLHLSIDSIMLQKCINQIRWKNKHYNENNCDNCKHNTDCEIK